jgi:hypothetical protein
MMLKYLLSSSASQLQHMEKNFNPDFTLARISKNFLPKPASLLSFVDYPLTINNYLRSMYRSPARCTNARSSG